MGFCKLTPPVSRPLATHKAIGQVCLQVPDQLFFPMYPNELSHKH